MVMFHHIFPLSNLTSFSLLSSPDYQRMRQRSLFRDGNRNFEFTIVMYHLIMAKKLQTPSQACRENDTAWQFIRMLANIPLSTWELRSRAPKESDFVIFFLLSHTKLLTSIRSLQTKTVIELLHAQDDIALIVVAPFNPFVCKLARVAVLASCGSAKQ